MELTSILNWALEGLQRLVVNGRFTHLLQSMGRFRPSGRQIADRTFCTIHETRRLMCLLDPRGAGKIRSQSAG
jgi:hypothetical protein